MDMKTSQVEPTLLAGLKRQLTESEGRFRHLVEKNRDGMLVLDKRNRLVYVNKSATVLFGENQGELLDEPLVFPPLKETEVEIEINNKLVGPLLVDALKTEILWRGQPSYLVILRDISERKKAQAELENYSHELQLKSQELSLMNETLMAQQKALEASKLQLEVLLNSAGEGIFGIDLSGNINFANPKACKLLCLPHDKILQRRVQDFFMLQDEDIHTLRTLVKTHTAKPTEIIEHWHKYQITQLFHSEHSGKKQHNFWHKSNGEKIYVEFSCNPTEDAPGQCNGAVVMFQNISERKRLEDKLLHLANFDPLTGLANRGHFHSSLQQALERQKRSDKTLAVLYLDMDHFKHINDSFGHDAGDRLLKLAADKLRANVRAGDLLARLGGDEFAVVLYDIKGPEDASHVAEKFIEALATPFDLATTRINISFSIGIATLSDELTLLDELVKAADTAMYAAKTEGRNNFKHYAASMQEKTEQKNRIQTQLQRAITDKELTLLYQPKISLAARKMTGCEALLRWYPSNQDTIGPAIFIPLAEESGQIVEIGEWVLKTACRQIKQWLTFPGFQGLAVAINVSTRQLGKNSFYPLLQQALRENNIPASAIEIEITETGVMENIDMVIDELQKIHDLGVKIAIDDFGTGNASIELLRKLPLDIVKMDQTFVKDIGKDKQDEELIRVMLAVAETLGLEVVAEGAETLEQIIFLSRAKCEVIQGYYFSKPVAPNQFSELISDSSGTFFNRFLDYYQAMATTANNGQSLSQ